MTFTTPAPDTPSTSETVDAGAPESGINAQAGSATQSQPDTAAQSVVNGTIPRRISGPAWIVDAAAARGATRRYMLKPPASAIGAAPRVMASRGALVALVLKDLDPGMAFVLKIKVNGTYTTVGTVTGQGSGQLLLPVMRFDAVQTYVLALVNPSGVPFYVKVVVT